VTIPVAAHGNEYREFLPDGTILCGYRGSVAHGTYRRDATLDDVDIIGVHVAPIQHYLGFRRKQQETVDRFEGKWDIVSHEARKYINLLYKNNPNVMDLLWLPDEMILCETIEGRVLRNNRDKFLSKQAYHAFKGYAYSQYENLEKDTFGGYMGAARKELVRQVGFDSKSASHLIRLLGQGVEWLTDGRVTLPRPNAGLLLDIKEGRWELERVKAYANDLFDDLDEARKLSDLPDRPNRDEVERLLVDVIASWHKIYQ